MLHKCLPITLTHIFTNFGRIVSGPVAFLGSVCLRRAVISATSALGKSKVIEETKLFLILVYLVVSRIFYDPFNYSSSIVCVKNIVFWWNTKCFLNY